MEQKLLTHPANLSSLPFYFLHFVVWSSCFLIFFCLAWIVDHMLFLSVPFSFAYGIFYPFSTDYPIGIFKVANCFMECIFGADCTVMCLFTLYVYSEKRNNKMFIDAVHRITEQLSSLFPLQVWIWELNNKMLRCKCAYVHVYI
jgi:hypothetical protein